MYKLLIKQLFWMKHVKTSKRATLYNSCGTNKLYYIHIWVDINQVDTNYENWSKNLIGFYLKTLDKEN